MAGFFFFIFLLHICYLLTSPAEIEKLFTDHYGALHRYAFTILKDEEEAKDVVQAVFLNLWEKKDNLSITSSPKAYLFRSVYHESLNFIKKREILQKHHHAAGATELNTEQKPFMGEEELFTRQRIDSVLDELPPQCREVFIKSRAEQKKYAEIAAEMGIAVKTVEAHMSKALKLIRQIVRVIVWVVCLYNDFI